MQSSSQGRKSSDVVEAHYQGSPLGQKGSRYRRQSAAGRRVALERKYRVNVDHYGGAVKLLTLTPPGQDLCAWGDESRVIAGEDVRMVAWEDRTVWNWSAQARASRLFEAAQRAADRFVRRQGWKGALPRQLGNVRAEQKRGLWHFHYLLPYESPVERLWSKTVHRFMDQSWRREQDRWTEQERRDFLWREYCGDAVPRGFYGFGFVNGGRRQGRTSREASGYMARNAAGYAASNAAGAGRHYVSSRLTRETGVTMRALRACNWLHVREGMIARGELNDQLVPSYWSPEWAAVVLRVYGMVTRPKVPDELAAES